VGVCILEAVDDDIDSDCLVGAVVGLLPDGGLAAVFFTASVSSDISGAAVAFDSLLLSASDFNFLAGGVSDLEGDTCLY